MGLATELESALADYADLPERRAEAARLTIVNGSHDGLERFAMAITAAYPDHALTWVADIDGSNRCVLAGEDVTSPFVRYMLGYYRVEDVLYWIRLALVGGVFGLVDGVLVEYPDGRSSTPPPMARA